MYTMIRGGPRGRSSVGSMLGCKEDLCISGMYHVLLLSMSNSDSSAKGSSVQEGQESNIVQTVRCQAGLQSEDNEESS